jgi:hypothetical protein
MVIVLPGVHPESAVTVPLTLNMPQLLPAPVVRVTSLVAQAGVAQSAMQKHAIAVARLMVYLPKR